MRIIIAGNGKVGATLTRQLAGEGHDLTLIDSNQRVLETSVERYDVMSIQGNCASMETLLQAEVKRADLLIATTSADEVNLLCCLTAHGINPKLRTIARIRSPEYNNQIYTMKELYPLSLAVNPEKQAAAEIERLLKFPGFLKRDTFAKGRVEIVELRIGEDSKLRDVPLSKLDSIIKCKVLVCAVLRNSVAVAPDGNFVLHEGDRIFVTAPTDHLTILLKNLGIITHKVRRVMLCGGGRSSYYLARQLQKSGVAVQLIEQDRERCLHLAAMLPAADIVQGDASDQALLEREGLTKCDALVTMTGLDELNIIISLYGNSRGVPQIITKVGRVGNRSILTNLPLGGIICPRELCCNTIVHYVRAMQNQAGAALSVHTIVEGQAEAVEFSVDRTTHHCGEPLKKIALQPNVLVVCITHGPKTEIPDGESTFSQGDTVILLSSGNHVIHHLNDIFLE